MPERCRKMNQSRKPRLLRIPGAVDYLDNVITKGTMRQWVYHGKIASVRVNGAVCIPVEALDALIERGRRKESKAHAG